MTDWQLSPEESAAFDEFVAHARADAIKKIHESALTICLSPPGSPEDFDVKQALEIGASILMNKPLVIVAWPSRPLPAGLRRAATHVIRLHNDIDTEAGHLELERKLQPILERLR